MTVDRENHRPGDLAREALCDDGCFRAVLDKHAGEQAQGGEGS